METRRVKLTFIDDVLGTQPGNKNIHEDFISSKAPDAETRTEELMHIPEDEMVNKEKTIFHKNPVTGEPEMASYHILGFFKGSCGFLRKVSGTKSSKLTAYKKVIDGLIKVYPNAEDKTGRFIPIKNYGEIGSCQRPLRASTPQGERVALANSEAIPAGASIEFDIVAFDSGHWGLIEEWLNYGEYNGLGQWRSSGKGAFTWEYC